MSLVEKHERALRVFIPNPEVPLSKEKIKRLLESISYSQARYYTDIFPSATTVIHQALPDLSRRTVKVIIPELRNAGFTIREFTRKVFSKGKKIKQTYYFTHKDERTDIVTFIHTHKEELEKKFGRRVFGTHFKQVAGPISSDIPQEFYTHTKDGSQAVRSFWKVLETAVGRGFIFIPFGDLKSVLEHSPVPIYQRIHIKPDATRKVPWTIIRSKDEGDLIIYFNTVKPQLQAIISEVHRRNEYQKRL